MLRPTGIVVVGLVSSLLLLTPGTAAAQSDEEDTVRARALFAEGVEHVESDRYAEAAAAFEGAYALRAAPAVAYNLAAVLEPLGRVVEARELVQSVLDDEESTPELRELAETLAPTLDARIGRLTILLEGDPSGVRVTLDDRPLSLAELDAAIDVDPGPHTAAAARGERVVASESVHVADGASVQLTLDLVEEEEAGGSIDLLDQWWFWATAGAVLVVGTVTTVAVASGGTEDPVPGTAGVVVFR